MAHEGERGYILSISIRNPVPEPVAMNEKLAVTRILCVDDEPQLLSALKRVFRSAEYAVDTAGDGFQGLEKLKENRYDVIISDMRMPHMDGAEFLTAAAQLMPDCPRILLTGFSDHESTVRAINDGKIFSYMSKPWDNNELRLAVQRALESRSQSVAQDIQSRPGTDIEQLAQENKRLEDETRHLLTEVNVVRHQLDETTAFLDLAQEELRESYATCLKVFANLVNLRLGNCSQISNLITDHVVAVATLMQRSAGEIAMIRNAAVLHQVGKMGLPDAIIRKPLQSLTPDERDIFATYPVKGEQVLVPLEVFHESGRVIRHQNENFDGSGVPDDLAGAAIPLGSRILRVVMDYLACVHGTKTGIPLNEEIARSYILAQQGGKYDPLVVSVYFAYLAANDSSLKPHEEMLLEVKHLLPGMTVVRDLHSEDGLLVVGRNTTLTRNLINHLRHHDNRGGHPIKVPVMLDITPSHDP